MSIAPSKAGPHPLALSALALAAGSLCQPALAETSPFYIGVSQALAYESNLYRLADDQATPANVNKRSDLISTTALVGGVDQPIGRQRLFGDLSLRTSRFASNDDLNNQSYGLKLGLDWSTINRISGTLSAGTSSNLRRFDANESAASRLQKNIETLSYVDAVARIGMVTRLTAEAGLNWRQVGYSAAAYNGAEYDQAGASLGLKYRLGGATTLGSAIRAYKTDYPSSGNSRNRQDFDLTVGWVPSGLSSLYGRVSYSQTDASNPTAGLPDFSGVTGELRGLWQATGKIRINARLLSDTGQNSAFQTAADTVTASNDFSRTTTTAQLGADYAFSAKINFTSSLAVARRDLSNSQFNLVTGNNTLTGNDTTTTLSLGARWQPTRAIQLGCDLAREQRSASGTLSTSSTLSQPYSNNSASCFAQFILQ